MEVFCEIRICEPDVCVLNETIDSDDYVFGSQVDTAVERFSIENKANLEYLPRHIGGKFPRLKDFGATGCSLNVIRDYFFENMLRLEGLFLSDNKIAFIERRAFKDLAKVKSLALERNLIESFHEELFQSMTNLKSIFLSDNQIKFLSPSTLDIPGAALEYLDFQSNVCIDNFYNARGLESVKLESDLIANCMPGRTLMCIIYDFHGFCCSFIESFLYIQLHDVRGQ